MAKWKITGKNPDGTTVDQPDLYDDTAEGAKSVDEHVSDVRKANGYIDIWGVRQPDA